MSPKSTRLCVGVLTCLALLGCGSKSPPQTPAAGRDSTASAAEQEAPVPVAKTDVETARTAVPTSTPVVVPAGESVPAIISRTFPTAGSVRRLPQPFPHRIIMDSVGSVLGYEAFSDSAGVTARGYGGMVPVQVFFDSRGRPLRIYIQDNYETPVYMDLVLRYGLLDTLLACDPAEPESVDAVTLATTSSRALIYGVTGLAARVSAEVVANGQGVR
jgi:hypothetical protein